MSSGPEDHLTRFAAGDPAAFETLVAEMGPRLKGFFLRQGANLHLAEDLVQNVFMRILRHTPRYQASGRLDAFCLRVARNLWIDNRRKAGRVFPSEDAAERADPSPGPDFYAGQSDRAEKLRQALAELDSGTRELLELAVLQQLPYKEVAMMLEIPVGTVKSRVYYCLRKLRVRLEALQEDFS